jgi:hypothetical protein
MQGAVPPVALYVPGMHPMQRGVPTLLLLRLVPGGHAPHVDAPSRPSAPESRPHATQAVAPGVAAKVNAGHCTHAAAPAVAAKDPAGHGVHAPDPAGAAVPGTQLTHTPSEARIAAPAPQLYSHAPAGESDVMTAPLGVARDGDADV